VRYSAIAQGCEVNRYYLDHNASSPLRTDVRAALSTYVNDPLGNPGGVHWHGQRARALVERVRRLLRQSIGRSDGRVVFTSGATEANNLLLKSLPTETVVVCSRIEHASVLEPLLGHSGTSIHWLEADPDGRLDPDGFARVARVVREGCLVLMAANNELGNLNDVTAFANVCLEFGWDMHVDAAQVHGRLGFDASHPGITSVTFSGHKAGGPPGVGALWVANEKRLRPQMEGGSQEMGYRSGTENVLALAGWEPLLAHPDEQSWQSLAAVRDELERWLEQTFGARANGDLQRRLPNTLHCSFPDRDAEEVVMALDLEQVSISAGSACTAGSQELSHVLRAMPWDDARRRGGVRISFGPEHVDLRLEFLKQRFMDALK